MIKNKKLVFFYIATYSILFVILFSLNFLYKKYVINLSLDNKYIIYSKQYLGLKNANLGNIFNSVFKIDNKKNSKYRIEEVEVENKNVFSQKSLTDIQFILFTSDIYNQENLEKEINHVYLESVYGMIEVLEKNKNLYDYDYILKQFKKNFVGNTSGENYDKQLSDYFNAKYGELINSNFFLENYIDHSCYILEQNCLFLLSNKYNNLLNVFKRESKNTFNVKYVKPKELGNSYYYIEIPKILGISGIFFYIFFILTNKFFSRKIK